jgi:hypothetical protein
MRTQALAGVGLCLALAACGSAKREPGPPTKREFLAGANGICAESTTRGTRVARLGALRPPAGTDDLYARWLRAERDALEATKSLAHAGEKKTKLDPAVALAIAEGKIAGYARRMGATRCAQRTIGTMPP